MAEQVDAMDLKSIFRKEVRVRVPPRPPVFPGILIQALNRINLQTLEKVLTVLWIGSLWTIGYLVVPTLFRLLPENRALAGTIAGQLFTIESYLGLVCGGVLLLMAISRAGRSVTWRTAVPGAMLALILLGEFGVRPLLAELKAQGLSQSAAFIRWHAVSAILYLGNSLLGLAWVILTGRRQVS